MIDDVRLGGGAATVRACLRAGLVDELHVAVGGARADGALQRDG
jgi:dihydrofolate reductase